MLSIPLYPSPPDSPIHATTIITVFLDCWRKQYVHGEPVARSALYVLDHAQDQLGNNKRMKKQPSRQYITSDFDIRNPETGRVIDSYDPFFIPTDTSLSASTTVNSNSDRFLRIEDIEAWSKGLDPAGTVPEVGWNDDG